MNRDNRFFADYALTGSFFWVYQYLILVILDPNVDPNGTERLIDRVSEWIKQGIQTLPHQIENSVTIAFLALIGVFVTGLVLDWFKVGFRALEMDAFHKHLLDNKHWLDEKMREFHPYDRYYGCFKQAALSNTNLFRQILVFLPSFRQDSGSREQAMLPPDRKTSYVNLHSFLISYVLLSSNSADLGPLTEGMRLWRTGREVSVAILVVAWEVLLIVALRLLSLLPSPNWHVALHPASPIRRLAPFLEIPASLKELPEQIAQLGLINVLVAALIAVLALKFSLSVLTSLFDRVCYALLPMFYTAVSGRDIPNTTVVLQGGQASPLETSSPGEASTGEGSTDETSQ